MTFKDLVEKAGVVVYADSLEAWNEQGTGWKNRGFRVRGQAVLLDIDSVFLAGDVPEAARIQAAKQKVDPTNFLPATLYEGLKFFMSDGWEKAGKPDLLCLGSMYNHRFPTIRRRAFDGKPEIIFTAVSTPYSKRKPLYVLRRH